MYAGKLVEMGTTEDVFTAPQMPYSIGLLRSVGSLAIAGAAGMFDALEDSR